ERAPDRYLNPRERRQPGLEEEVAEYREPDRQAVVDVNRADEVPGLALEEQPARRTAGQHAHQAAEQGGPAAARASEPERASNHQRYASTVHLGPPSRPLTHGRASSTRPRR